MTQKPAKTSGAVSELVFDKDGKPHPNIQYTTSFLPVYMPVPRGEELDPVVGLGPSAHDCLIRPQESNNFRAPVRSITVPLRPKNPNAKRGKKLIDVASLLAFLDSLPNDGERPVNP
jgi:hypothetical protein